MRHPNLKTQQSETEIKAMLSGPLGAEAGRLLRGLATRVKRLRPITVVLDISHADQVEPEGLSGLFDLQQATEDVRGYLEVQAGGPRAAILLAKAGLAHSLCTSPDSTRGRAGD